MCVCVCGVTAAGADHSCWWNTIRFGPEKYNHWTGCSFSFCNVRKKISIRLIWLSKCSNPRSNIRAEHRCKAEVIQYGYCTDTHTQKQTHTSSEGCYLPAAMVMLTAFKGDPGELQSQSWMARTAKGVCVCVCICISVCACINEYIYIYIYMLMCGCSCVCVCLSTCVYPECLISCGPQVPTVISQCLTLNKGVVSSLLMLTNRR